LKSDDKLHSLIKSLTPPEKGYFKKLSASKQVFNKGENYVRLFEAIERMKEYDESKLKSEFRKEKFIIQLGVAKKYLYHQILASLASYHSETSERLALNNLFDEFYVLFERGLHDQALSVLRTIKSNIEDNGLSRYRLAEVLHYEKFVKPNDSQEIISEKLKSVNEQENKLYEELKNISDYHYLGHCFSTLKNKTTVIRTAGQLAELREFMSHPLLSQVGNAESDTARLYFYMLNSMYCLRVVEFDKSFEMSSMMVKTFEEMQKGKKSNLEKLSNIYHEFLFICSCTGRHKELKEEVKKYRALLSGESKHKSKVVVNNLYDSYIFELKANIYLGKPELNFEVVKKLEDELGKHKSLIIMTHTLEKHYYVAMTHVIFGNYNEALECTNQILTIPEVKNQYVDFFIKISILNLIIHFELGNIELVISLIRSIYYFMGKQEYPLGIEREIIAFFRKLSGVNNNKQLTELFRELSCRIRVLAKDPFERYAYDDLDLIMKYLESKVDGRLLEEIMRREFLKSFKR